MTCPICSTEHNKKGIYCQKKCGDKAYRDRKKGNGVTTLLIKRNEVKSFAITIPKETGPKLRWCNFCGASIEHSFKQGFCNNDHEKDYWVLVHNNGTLKLKIDSRTIIETRKYTKVQEIINAMEARNNGITIF